MCALIHPKNCPSGDHPPRDQHGAADMRRGIARRREAPPPGRRPRPLGPRPHTTPAYICLGKQGQKKPPSLAEQRSEAQESHQRSVGQ